MWGLQRGISVIPRSVNLERIRANFELDGWSLDDNEVTTLNSVQGVHQGLWGWIFTYPRVFRR